MVEIMKIKKKGLVRKVYDAWRKGVLVPRIRLMIRSFLKYNTLAIIIEAQKK